VSDSRNDPPSSEADAVRARYARRSVGDLYSIGNPDVRATMAERQQVMLELVLGASGWPDFTGRRLLDVGCGSGGSLLEFLRFGFEPELLAGIELLAARAAAARRVLPAAIVVHEQDATRVELAPGSQDVVFQSVVFSSLLDPAFQQALASRMWHWVRPGGGVLWYDFIYDNPRNPDVRGVPLSRVRQLFPQAVLSYRRVTLAPPIARRACRIHPALYPMLNLIPFLRSHVLCWLAKPA